MQTRSLTGWHYAGSVASVDADCQRLQRRGGTTATAVASRSCLPARPPERTEDGKTIAAPAAFCSPAVGWRGNEIRERPVCLFVGLSVGTVLGPFGDAKFSARSSGRRPRV